MNSSPMEATAPRRVPGGATNCVIRFPATSARVSPQPCERDTASTGNPAGGLDVSFLGVDFRPSNLAKRQTATWPGLSGEVVPIIRQEPFESKYCGPSHLLIAYEQAARHRGETMLEGLPRSTLRDFSHKLTFVPAGRRFQEWQEPRVLARTTYFYIDPRGPLMNPEAGFAAVDFEPRLFFDSPLLWQTARKLTALIEAGPSGCRSYAEALGVVLAHELLRFNSGMAAVESRVRGGLASWQRRVVAQYVEDNLAEHISLAQLAGLAQLSPYHFCRAFKQSFGAPPHRYHTRRRIERAKMLLAKPNLSVTEIALEVGFGETSSFTAAFRRLSGQTPTGYRRSFI